MNLNGFTITIPEGRETTGGYVYVDHATVYSLLLENDTHSECDAEVSIDGLSVGTWRVKAKTKARIERPVSDIGRFTFYMVGTPEADKAQIQLTQQTGLVKVVFRPGSNFVGLSSAPAPGGTGLSGISGQDFTTVRKLNYREGQEVTIHLRLVGITDQPRPLPRNSTPIPPPVA